MAPATAASATSTPTPTCCTCPHGGLCANLQKSLPTHHVWKGWLEWTVTTNSKAQEVIVRSLGIQTQPEKQDPSSNTTTTTFIIARHHWMPQFLKDWERLRGGWKGQNTKFTVTEACQYSYLVRMQDCIYVPQEKKKKTKNNNNNASIQYYLPAPNVPLHVVQTFVCSLSHSNNKKKRQREETIDDMDDDPLSQLLDNRRQIVQDLVHDQQRLQAKVDSLKKQLQQAEHQKQQQRQQIPSTIGFGFSRATLCCPDWHASHPTAAMEFFGHATWAETVQVVQERFPTELPAPPKVVVTVPKKKQQQQQQQTPLVSIDPPAWEQCLCVLMMDRTGLTKGRMAILLDRHVRTISAWRAIWCPKWEISRDGHGQVLRMHFNQVQRAPRKEDDQTNNSNAMNIMAAMKQTTGHGEDDDEHEGDSTS